MSAVTSLDPTEGRRQRGLVIAAVCKITERDGFYTVPSQSGGGSYTVTLNPPYPDIPMCSCKDYETRGKPCKHVFAVRFLTGQEGNQDGAEPVAPSIPLTIPPTVNVAKQTCAPRPTYKQVWPAYNAAQINEKVKFQVLLADLCRGIPEPTQSSKGGRPPIPMADRVFSVAFKVYTTISGRRASTDMRDARDKGHLSRAPHYSRVSRFLEDPAMTPILRGLIAESAKPLRAVEVDFTVDSSGFSTSRFVRWFDHKYGKPMAKYDWVKVSLMCGVKTNVVTAVIVDEKKGGDCPQFAPLFQATVENFTVKEASADAAYLSYENAELVASYGGTPFIAFKSNTTAAEGGMFAKMFHFYQFRRDEFLSHYHKRSNAESTFSMIKAKFGDSLRSKTDTAMVNEALCKVLCHNICCLIQSMYELGIEPLFWREDLPEPQPEAETTSATVEAWDWL